MILGLILTALPGSAGAGSIEDRKAGLAAMEAGDLDKAIAFFTSGLASDDLWPPTEMQILESRGIAYRQTGQLDLAREDFEFVLTFNHEHKIVRLNLAFVLYEQGEYEGCITEMDKYIARIADGAEGYFLRGKAHAKLGDKQAALADAKQAVSLDPKDSHKEFLASLNG